MPGHRTKLETVNATLAKHLKKRRKFVQLFGTIDFRPDWDHKKARRRS